MGRFLPSLPGLQAFEATSRSGSFVAAARELHLSPAAVSQRVRLVETDLGFALFERLPRSLRLTDMGRAYLPIVQDALNRLEIGTSGLLGPAEGDVVTIRGGISHIVGWLSPRAPDLLEALPEVSVRMLSALWPDVGDSVGVDIDIMIASQSQAPLDAELLSHEEAVVIGHPDDRFPVTGSGLAAKPRVQVIGFDNLWGRFFTAHDHHEVERSRVAVDSSSAAIALVAATPGWYAIVPASYAEQALQNRTVSLATSSSIEMGLSHWLRITSDSDRRAAPAVVAVADWLRDQGSWSGKDHLQWANQTKRPRSSR